jgi:hypothetical protein
MRVGQARNAQEGKQGHYSHNTNDGNPAQKRFGKIHQDFSLKK